MPDIILSRRVAAGTDAPLDAWRDNVGAALAVDGQPRRFDPVRTVVVLSWNMWIGRGNLAGIVSRIRDGSWSATGIPRDTPIVALIQEAYRADDSIPAASNGHGGRDFSGRSRREHEIRAVAEQLKFNLRYAPSMRNGPYHSDRGNAILSDLPLVDTLATELPFAMQRRVAVSATVVLDGLPIRVHAAHLDPRGGSALDLLGLRGRLAQVQALISSMPVDPQMPQLLGADLNLVRHRREPAFRALVDAGFVTGIPEVAITWPHTYHRQPRLMLDWILLANRGERIRRVAVQRLDENLRDAGRYVFGSDHHPLLAMISLDPEPGA